MTKPVVIAICGPTASGKSALGLELATRLNGEIVCMDSMQIYRRMDIGTAKPTAGEQAIVPHHMLDIVEPTESYAVADYAQTAQQVLLQVAQRGKTPILVGGTGLYLKALMHGMSLGGIGSDPALREKLNAIAMEEGGKERLHTMLKQVDPESARKLHPNDVRRVVRAIEVYELSGMPISAQQEPPEPDLPYRVVPLTIDVPREALYQRLEKRVLQMMSAGLLDEVRCLLQSGVTPDMQSMQGIGYKELVPVIGGEHTQDRAVWNIVHHTRHYAKRQGTWMRTEPRTVWLDGSQGMPLDAAMRAVEAAFEQTKGTDEE